MATHEPKATDTSSDTIVVSFRAPRELVAQVAQLDDIAKSDQRTRANFIVRVLTHAVTLEPAIITVELSIPARA